MLVKINKTQQNQLLGSSTFDLFINNKVAKKYCTTPLLNSPNPASSQATFQRATSLARRPCPRSPKVPVVFPKSGCLPKSHLAHQVDWPHRVAKPVAQESQPAKHSPFWWSGNMMISSCYLKKKGLTLFVLPKTTMGKQLKSTGSETVKFTDLTRTMFRGSVTSGSKSVFLGQVEELCFSSKGNCTPATWVMHFTFVSTSFFLIDNNP